MKKVTFCLTLSALIFFYSCEEIVMEDDISNETVLLVAPAAAADFFSTGITFTWEPVEYVTQYRIQIARPNFEDPLQIVVDNVVETTSFTTQLNVGEYQWRVQAFNSGYSTLYSTRSFRVVSNEDFQSNTVTLSTPANNSITNSAAQNLSWQPVLGATSYHLQIVNESNSTVIFEQDMQGSSYNYTFPQGTFTWKVRASNGEQNTLYSSRLLQVDTAAPNTPTLSSPANLSNTSDNDVIFQWSRASMAGSAEIDSIYIFTNNTLTNLQYKNQHTSPYNTSTLPDGTYFWFVKAFDKAGNTSEQSAVFSFTLN